MNLSTSSSGPVGSPQVDSHEEDWLFVSSDSAVSKTFGVVEEEPESGEKGKLKSKLVSAWNSVKYGWSFKQKSHFNKTSPVIMFGQSYLLSNQANRRHFRLSFASLLWLTYRRGFPELDDGSLTTDSGWGCILRSGQMMLARGLLLHLMPEGWTWSSGQCGVKDDMDLPAIRSRASSDTEWSFVDGPKKAGRQLSLGSGLQDCGQDSTHRQVVSWFADLPDAPFGIHQLVECGKSAGKRAGDWYGPAIVAHILRKAVSASREVPNLSVYVAQDCTIYVDDLRKVCERPLSSCPTTCQPWKSVIILVPVRLGGQDLNPAYIACVKEFLRLRCCIGIIGGKPKHSLFFVGFQGEHLLYLDPHYCQPVVDVKRENFPMESFHCKYPRKMSFSRMDPSCTFGFYAENEKDFESLRSVVNGVLSSCEETYPMFIFRDGSSQEDGAVSASLTNDIIHIRRTEELRRTDTSNSMDEFVLL